MRGIGVSLARSLAPHVCPARVHCLSCCTRTYRRLLVVSRLTTHTHTLLSSDSLVARTPLLLADYGSNYHQCYCVGGRTHSARIVDRASGTFARTHARTHTDTSKCSRTHARTHLLRRRARIFFATQLFHSRMMPRWCLKHQHQRDQRDDPHGHRR